MSTIIESDLSAKEINHLRICDIYQPERLQRIGHGLNHEVFHVAGAPKCYKIPKRVGPIWGVSARIEEQNGEWLKEFLRAQFAGTRLLKSPKPRVYTIESDWQCGRLLQTADFKEEAVRNAMNTLHVRKIALLNDKGAHSDFLGFNYNLRTIIHSLVLLSRNSVNDLIYSNLIFNPDTQTITCVDHDLIRLQLAANLGMLVENIHLRRVGVI